MGAWGGAWVSANRTRCYYRYGAVCGNTHSTGAGANVCLGKELLQVGHGEGCGLRASTLGAA